MTNIKFLSLKNLVKYFLQLTINALICMPFLIIFHRGLRNHLEHEFVIQIAQYGQAELRWTYKIIPLIHKEASFM